MPNLSFFADERDVPVVLDRLNADPEVAFIVPDGPMDPAEALAARLEAAASGQERTFYMLGSLPDGGYRQRWKAVPAVERLADGPHALWHVPAGPLPLLGEHDSEPPIPDPWGGWVEQRPGADRLVPYFGPAHHAHVRLVWNTRHLPYSADERARLPLLNGYWDRSVECLAVSNLGWMGGRRCPQNAMTWRWWGRLKSWVARSAVDVGDRHPFWAFPSALTRLKGGIEYDAHGWVLRLGDK